MENQYHRCEFSSQLVVLEMCLFRFNSLNSEGKTRPFFVPQSKRITISKLSTIVNNEFGFIRADKSWSLFAVRRSSEQQILIINQKGINSQEGSIIQRHGTLRYLCYITL
jgi:hypothetical protein